MVRRPFSYDNGAVIKRILDTLTSRRVSVALMVFVAGAGLVGALVPQRANNSLTAFEAWQLENPTYSGVADALQLDRVFSSWWSLLGLVIFFLSMSIATGRMLVLARRRWRGVVPGRPTPLDGTTFETTIAAAKSLGYRQVSSSADGIRFARHRIGWWGPALMHLGMVVALVAGIVSSGFDAHGVLDFSVGEIHRPGDEYLYQESGLLGGPPQVGSALRLDGVEAELWETGEVRFLTAVISVLGEDGVWTRYESSANEPLAIGSYMVYVSPTEFGDASFVQFSGDEVPDLALRLEFPETPAGQVTYFNAQPPDWPLIESRLDPSGVRDDSEGKPLAIRIQEGDVIHQAALAIGETAEFGPYSATLVAQADWARLVVVRPVWIEAIFLGFAIICLGSLMIYLYVPRELYLVHDEDGHPAYSWRAARMPRAYVDELDAILGRDGDQS